MAFPQTMQLFSLLLLVAGANCLLHKDFMSFIKRRYGRKVADQLDRADLGDKGAGSFGGGHYTTKRRPVVMIHGLRNKSGYLWRNREALRQNGWDANHVLATSWGNGDQGVVPAMQETLKCAYVKQIRHMLLATINYYKSDIDVMAFSMGSPLTRKAIMGGRCVDTNEYIGEPLTKHINTYLSVAGANHGSSLCNMIFPGICELDAGLNCMSKFLKDINSKTHYEGKHRYFILSTMDEIVGLFNGCGDRSAAFVGGVEVLLHGKNHEDTMFKAVDVQVDVLKKHI